MDNIGAILHYFLLDIVHSKLSVHSVIFKHRLLVSVYCAAQQIYRVQKNIKRISVEFGLLILNDSGLSNKIISNNFSDTSNTHNQYCVSHTINTS